MPSPLITSWPNASAGGQAPPSALEALSGRVSMFGGDTGPRFTGPVNFSNPYAGLLQSVGPPMLQMLMGNSHMPTQIFQEQNLQDQINAQRHMEAQQAAMAFASRRDTGTIENVLNGITQVMTREPLTQIQQARNYRIAGGVAGMLPILANVLGPDLLDQLHGSRGSATVLAQQLQQAMHTGLDPLTARIGYSGQSADVITQEVFEKMFGQNADIGVLKGMSAGQAGLLINELQSRGMLGQPLGAMSLDERRQALPKQLSEDTINRLAENLPEIQKILQEGGTPDEVSLRQARETVRTTHAKLTDPAAGLNREQLDQLPGAADIVRVGDAERITQRLHNMAGAVKAMRDIFGDMGHPNAPMREILNGLDALTQGGLATMSPGQLEMLVRRTHSIAKQTGIGVEGMIALTTQNAALADQLGLDRSFAVTAAQQAALFGAAAGDRLRLDMPVWGAQTKEQLLLGDQQLRMHAAASPMANQLNAVLRMSDTGMAAPAPDTELAAVIGAIRQGQPTYEFQGRKRDVTMPHARLMQLLQRDAGIDETQAFAVLNDIGGNQEFGQRHNTTELVRRLQVDETARRMLTPTISNRLRGALADAGVDQMLQVQGVTKDDRDFQQFMHRVGQGVGQDFLKLDPATVRTPEKKREALGDSVRSQLRQQIITRLPAAAPEEIDAIVDAAVTQLGGEKGMRDIGTTVAATINTVARSHPTFKTDVNMHNLLHVPTMQQANARDREATLTALTQSAMAGLGTGDPLRRFVDAMQQAGPDTALTDILTQTLGGVSRDAIAAADPAGPLAQVFGLIKQNSDLDPTDPKQFAAAQQNANIMRGLVEGGDVAAEQVRKLDESRAKVSVEAATAAQQTAALTKLAEQDRKQTTLRDVKLTNQERQLATTGERIDRLRNGTVPEAKRGEEQRAVTASVQAMASNLTKDIPLGENRFLTRRGIVTRRADGTTASVSGFNELAVAATAIDVFTQQHMQAKDAAAIADDAKEQEGLRARLKRASDAGLLRGDLTVGNDLVYRQLAAAAKRGPDSSILGPLGYQLGATVSTAHVDATVDSGNAASKILAEKSATAAERTDMVNAFLHGAKARGQQLLMDERSMNIIGHGGLELIQQSTQKADQLQSMAEAETKRTGKTITVADLLQGHKGVAADTTKKALKTFEDMRSDWAEISHRRGFGAKPGEGADPENLKRLPMTEQERKDIAARQEFLKSHGTAEQRAASVVERLAEIATPAQRERMLVDTNRKTLIEAISKGDRGVYLDRAISSRQSLLEMGLRKGVFGKKKKLSELTDADEAAAAERIDALQLEKSERADFDRLRRDSKLFMDFGEAGVRASDITSDALRRIKDAPTTHSNAPDTQDKKLEVTVTGNVTTKSDGTMDLALQGAGVFNQIGQMLGFS